MGKGRFTRRYRSYNDAPYALIQPFKKHASSNGASSDICIQLFILGRLDSCFECVERIDYKVNCESSYCPSLCVPMLVQEDYRKM